MQLPMLLAKDDVSCRHCNLLVAVRNLQVEAVAGRVGTGIVLEVAGVVVEEVEQSVEAEHNLAEVQAAVAGVAVVQQELVVAELAKVLVAALAGVVVEGDFG